MSQHHGNEAVRTAAWLSDHLDEVRTDGPDYRLVEVDMEPAVYDDWHIPGAVRIDWEADLIDGLGGNVVDPDDLGSLLGELGITRDTTVILYGDKANWFAAHAYWVLRYYCHADVQLLDGGRRLWELEGYETTTETPDYTAREYTPTGTDQSVRATRNSVRAAIDEPTPIVDVRNPQEYRGEKPPAEVPDTTDREGHIPGADNVPWGQAVNADGTFKSEPELRDVYADQIESEGDAIAYCRIGERSSITWFVLSELLGANARNYDGSWTEWAADPDAPVERANPRTDGGGE